MSADAPQANGIARLFQALTSRKSGSHVTTVGLRGAARGYVLAELARKFESPLVCVTADEDEADALASDLAFFLGGMGTAVSPRVLRIPVEEVTPYDEMAPDPRISTERLGALFHLSQGRSFRALVLSRTALSRKVIPPKVFEQSATTVRTGEDTDRDDLARKLADMGYQSSPLVEDVGTFSVRGSIVDVFPPLYDSPVRIELFGDTVESIRTFDTQSQRTTGSVPELHLIPARELAFNEHTRRAAESSIRSLADSVNIPTSKLRERLEQIREGIAAYGLEALVPGFYEGGLSTLFDYIDKWSDRPLFYLDDPLGQDRAATDWQSELDRTFESAKSEGELGFPPDAHFMTGDDVTQALRGRTVISGGGLALTGTGAAPFTFTFGGTQDLREAIKSHHGEEGALTPLLERLERWQQLHVATAIASGSPGQADRLKRLLMDRNLSVRVHPEPLVDASKLFEPGIAAHLFTHEVSQGFVDSAGGFAVIADEEIFGARARRTVRKRKAEKPFGSSFDDLEEGNLIVHSDFGIGRYAGLTKMQVGGIPGDFLVLEYAGRDKIYLPVSRMRLIQKFTGGDQDRVALDKLGTATWERTKKRVKEHLLKMAAELLQLYAGRKAHPGNAFSAPDRYFRQFEADFEFDETADQEKAIAEVLVDMQKSEPMDRLVCGDVGYGKTEVAMRAAFKAVLDRKQVAVLVPTTVLAQQHFNSFSKRMKDYPVSVDVVSGMRKPEQVRDAMRKAKEGKVDILIGTHKLLGREVGFKDLGLLIVDEEQRFGVKQKERIKTLRTQVDVLTLTATPIPRTLNMAMSGLRDMSIIASPPTDRRAIRTFVTKFDPVQIREAILREIQRGGQVFFVHNRVESIGAMEQQLKELMPEISIGVGHGQMGEGQLEKVMVGFVEKRFQVLLCTSIIESGIDISSANTMIVNRADTFGLAQLYQLRGRVGRSRERAYAYLLVPPKKTITKDAQRRLEVLQQFSELGAGFTIASHDLEIRGAGNLLGPDQSGAIAAIGFDLYTQLFEEAVAEMRGEAPRTAVEPDVSLPLAALIPDDYVPDVHQRLTLYKRFSTASSPDELEDLRAELVDRFGEAPDEVDNLSALMLMKIDMRDLRLRALESGPGRLVFTLGPDADLNPAKLAALVQRSRGTYRLTPDMKLIARVPEGLKGQNLLAEAKKVLADIVR